MLLSRDKEISRRVYQVYMNMSQRFIKIMIRRKGRSWEDYKEEAGKDISNISGLMYQVFPAPQNRIVAKSS